MTLTESLYPFYRSIAFKFEPEFIHDISMTALALAERFRLISSSVTSASPVECMGITFPNIVGVAAGLDKEGSCVDAFASMGFGSVEVGTVTPRPQPGNPKPRLFRLINDQAVINRMGFNNPGVDRLIQNVAQQKRRCVLGINIGKNKDTPEENTIDDYLYSFVKVYSVADYVAINISSPNTPGLREFGQGKHLVSLLETIKAKQRTMAQESGRYVPVALKISPDMTEEQLRSIVDLVKGTGFDSIIATNTTVNRDNLQSAELAKQTGGLSGEPLNKRSTEIISIIRDRAGKELPIIGVGGILTKEDAQAKLKAGANLLQLYTGFIYQGPKLIREIVENSHHSS